MPLSLWWAGGVSTSITIAMTAVSIMVLLEYFLFVCRTIGNIRGENGGKEGGMASGRAVCCGAHPYAACLSLTCCCAVPHRRNLGNTHGGIMPSAMSSHRTR